jgi:hypothetical protein
LVALRLSPGAGPAIDHCMQWRGPAMRRLVELLAFALLALALAVPLADRGFHLIGRLG